MLGVSPALAQRDDTATALDRLEEVLRPEVEEGSLSPQGIGPILLVGATPAFAETQAWFPVAALDGLIRIFGRGNVRVCEACLAPRVYIEDGRLEHNSTLSLSEVARIDTELRGNGAPARSAVWIEETTVGIAVRIIAIDNGQVLYAGNLDASLGEKARTSRVYNYTLELGRRSRGETLTHIFVDAAVLPAQHFSLDIVEQFGPHNLNLAGVTFSVLDPVVGVGVAYYRVIPVAWNLTIGAQAVLSLPTALINALPGEETIDELIDPLVTGVLVVRFPIPSTSIAILAMGSTNLNFGVGLSFLNSSFLPFLP